MRCLNVKPQYLYPALHDEDNAVTEGNATTPSAGAHSGGCLTSKGGFRSIHRTGLRSEGYF